MTIAGAIFLSAIGGALTGLAVFVFCEMYVGKRR